MANLREFSIHQACTEGFAVGGWMKDSNGDWTEIIDCTIKTVGDRLVAAMVLGTKADSWVGVYDITDSFNGKIEGADAHLKVLAKVR